VTVEHSREESIMKRASRGFGKVKAHVEYSITTSQYKLGYLSGTVYEFLV
jgi:hypothetical protein